MQGRIWTVPNQITLLRLGFLPLFLILIVYEHYRWALLILVLAGLGVAALGVHLGRTTFLLQSSGERVQGTVLFLELKKTLHGSTYYPVVQFATLEGTTVQFRDVMGTNPPAYREGDPVDVLYFRNLPEGTATIDRGMLDWLVPGILCVLGAFLAGIALWARLGAFG